MRISVDRPLKFLLDEIEVRCSNGIGSIVRCGNFDNATYVEPAASSLLPRSITACALFRSYYEWAVQLGEEYASLVKKAAL